MRYLVTGGAGYVGSHIVLRLLDDGHEVEVIDNLTSGNRDAVPPSVRLHEFDLHDMESVEKTIANGEWGGVFHLAALSLSSESMDAPFLYLEHNFNTSLNLVKACLKHRVNRLVFSSTAALYGGPDRFDSISETSPIIPSSPYGESKRMVESLLLWADRIHGLKSACLRYFNVAGADPKGRAGENRHPETHLIPLCLDAMLGRRDPLSLYGTDYPTHDGTAIRDYIHVSDVADAHIRALRLLDGQSLAYNLGSGRGYSNLEVIQSVERVSGRPVPFHPAPRREGDPAVLVANSERFRNESGWTPQLSGIDQIVEAALAWRVKQPKG